MRQMLRRAASLGHRIVASLDWLAPLLVRLFFGYFWAETGWGKIHNLDAFTQRFIGWGIPHPYLSALLSGYTEWLGGILLMVGLLTRFVSIPLIFNMFVAIVKVKLKTVTDVDDFVEMDEALYVLVFFWLMMAGPGRASLDHLMAKVLNLNNTTASSFTAEVRQTIS